ncbi:winged helix-turn-helix domain-containing protein [Agitococcus lubricus]|uniref:Molybdate transport system regulatory protein n=1 Tax=Agitococcus lubricus TaxID=1077255 RepID=A0A2T5J246_9GAMM|nr:LysR family transcriptional regulator [Agitococcus lubricus]PTQ90517.1 molybdate transport system regulatory protein [Agitococcus lubricus]
MPSDTTPLNYLKTQIRLMKGSDIALGPGKVDLLAAIMDTGSISAAGRQLGMSYRRAWLLVETMNTCFVSPLVVSTKGGKHGGGAQLTELGVEVLHIYQTMQQQVQQQLKSYEQQLCGLLTQVNP